MDPAGTPPERGGGRHRAAEPPQQPKPVLVPWLRALGRGVLRYRPSTWRDMVLGALLMVAGASAFRGEAGVWGSLGLLAIGVLGIFWTVVTARQLLREAHERERG